MGHDTTISEAFGLGNMRDKLAAMRRLSKESRASILEAKDALEETGFEMEAARRLLKRRGLWEKTPQTPRAKLVSRIEAAEGYKRFRRAQFDQDMARVDRQIEDMKEELASLGHQLDDPRLHD